MKRKLSSPRPRSWLCLSPTAQKILAEKGRTTAVLLDTLRRKAQALVQLIELLNERAVPDQDAIAAMTTAFHENWKVLKVHKVQRCICSFDLLAEMTSSTDEPGDRQACSRRCRCAANGLVDRIS